jgi:putative FmdB family regulatory protein
MRGNDPMPIYEYECNLIGESFEKMVQFSEADRVPVCTKCEGKDTHKKISFSVSFGTTGLGTIRSTGSSCGSSGGFT